MLVDLARTGGRLETDSDLDLQLARAGHRESSRSARGVNVLSGWHPLVVVVPVLAMIAAPFTLS